jgi:hypothetical protein
MGSLKRSTRRRMTRRLSRRTVSNSRSTSASTRAAMTSWMRASLLRSRGYLQSLFFRVYPAPPFMPFRLCTPYAHLMTPTDP